MKFKVQEQSREVEKKGDEGVLMSIQYVYGGLYNHKILLC